MQYSRTLGYSPTGLCRILPLLQGMDTLLGCFFLNAHQVVGHLGHKDTVAILQSHMIQINLTVGIKQHKRIDRFSWGSNALFLLLDKRPHGRGGCCYGNLLVGCVEHIIGIATFHYLWCPETCSTIRGSPR